MKKLIALINPKDKSKEQLKNELKDAFGKYKEAEKEVLENIEDADQQESTGFQVIGLPSPKDEEK